MKFRERQLSLDLPTDPAHGIEDFLVSPSNEAAYLFIEAWPQWPDRRLLLLGPAGSGKSHLSAIWAERARARTIAARRIQDEAIPALLASRALVVEDLDQADGMDAALFHLLNLALETQSSLLLTARSHPSHWQIRVADLLSRLRALPKVETEPPDDALLKAVLVKLFVDRQLVVDTTTIDYLALHLDRSLDAARAMVAALDREALSRGRRITRAMAADLLKAECGPDMAS